MDLRQRFIRYWVELTLPGTLVISEYDAGPTL